MGTGCHAPKTKMAAADAFFKNWFPDEQRPIKFRGNNPRIKLQNSISVVCDRLKVNNGGRPPTRDSPEIDEKAFPQTRTRSTAGVRGGPLF